MPERVKHIVINAATVKLAGGLVVTLDFIELLKHNSEYRVHLLCPKIKVYRALSGKLNKIYSPRILLTPYFRFVLDFLWIPLCIRKIKPDLVITLGNLPAKTHVRQIMLNDNAFVSQQNLAEIPVSRSEAFKHSIRKRLFWKRLKYVDVLLVQTDIEKKRLESIGRKHPEIRVLPPLLPSHLKSCSGKGLTLADKPSQFTRLVCLSFYWSHKNIEVLLEVLRLAQTTQVKLQIVFTLNQKKIKGGQLLVEQLKPFIEAGYAINVGNLPAHKVGSLIKQCDGVILPSILETFGLNCLEAWYFGKLFFVADRPYSREVCKGAAVLFDPYSPQDILSKVLSAFKNSEEYKQLVAEGTKRIEQWHYNDNYLQLVKENCSL